MKMGNSRNTHAVANNKAVAINICQVCSIVKFGKKDDPLLVLTHSTQTLPTSREQA